MRSQTPGFGLLDRLFRPTLICAAGVFVGCLVASGPALASASAGETIPEAHDSLAELSLEELLGVEVVYAASKYEQAVAEAPASVTVITSEDIQRSGYRTLAEVLNSVRGFYVTYDRNYYYIGVRGFGPPGDYNSRILLLVNGHRLNDGVSGAASIGPEFAVDVNLIDRVEIVRGPSSSIYGASAFLAVVNVVTEVGGQRDGLSASVRAGSFNSRETQVTYGNTFRGGLEVLASASLSRTDGQDLYFEEYDDPETNNGVAESADYGQATNLFALLSYKNFTLQASSVSSEKGVPTASYDGVFNDSRTLTVDEASHIDLRYEQAFSHQIGLTVRTFYDRYDYDGDYVYDYGEEGDPYVVVNRDWSRASWWGTEVQLSKMFSEDHRGVFGVDFQNYFRQDQGNFDEEVYLDDRRSSSSWSVYAQDEIPLGVKVRLNLGLRHDHYDLFGGSTNPRIALIYSPFDRSTVKLIYGTAFRAPNAYELFYHDDSVSQKPALHLEPEEILTYELAWEQEIGRKAWGTVSVFDYTITNLITLTTDPGDDLLVYRNVGRVESDGVEIELRRRWAPKTTTVVSYTYQDTRDTLTGETLPNSPRHLAKFKARSLIPGSEIFADLELDYRSESLTVRGNSADDFVLANLTFSTSLIQDRLEAAVGVYNLLDEEYGHVVSDAHAQDLIQQNGRTWRLKLQFNF